MAISRVTQELRAENKTVVLLLYCQSWKVLCHQKQRIHGDWTYLGRWGLWLGHFFRSFPWRGRDLVTSTLHSRLLGRLWKELGSMVLGSYQDHPVQLFSYVAELQTQFQRIDEPNAQKKTPNKQTNQTPNKNVAISSHKLVKWCILKLKTTPTRIPRWRGTWYLGRTDALEPHWRCQKCWCTRRSWGRKLFFFWQVTSCLQTNSIFAPENWWLEDYFRFLLVLAYFQVWTVSFGGCTFFLQTSTNHRFFHGFLDLKKPISVLHSTKVTTNTESFPWKIAGKGRERLLGITWNNFFHEKCFPRTFRIPFGKWSSKPGNEFTIFFQQQRSQSLCSFAPIFPLCPIERIGGASIQTSPSSHCRYWPRDRGPYRTPHGEPGAQVREGRVGGWVWCLGWLAQKISLGNFLGQFFWINVKC